MIDVSKSRGALGVGLAMAAVTGLRIAKLRTLDRISFLTGAVALAFLGLSLRKSREEEIQSLNYSYPSQWRTYDKTLGDRIDLRIALRRRWLDLVGDRPSNVETGYFKVFGYTIPEALLELTL